MRKFSLVGGGLLFLSVAVFTGCTGQQGSEKSTTKKEEEDHGDHGPGPHKGTIIEFGKWHGEFTVDHKTKEATVYILGTDVKTAVPLQVEKLLLSIKTPQFQVDLKAVPQTGDPTGKSSRFVGKHENFGTEQEFEGTVSGMVDGKQYAGDFKEKEEKDHKHEKK